MNTANSAATVPPPPPPAIRGLISGAIFAALFLTVAPPAAAQTLTLTITNNNGDRNPATPELEVDEGDTVTITLSLVGSGVGLWSTTIVPQGTATSSEDHTIHPTLGISFILNPGRTESTSFTITDDNLPEPDETIIIPMLMRTQGAIRPINTVGPVTITIRQNDGYVDPNAPVPDNPTARAERLDAPAGAIVRGVGVPAAEAVVKRVGGGDGFNFWAGGGYISAEGDHEGVTYDGDTSAFHLGIDTTWRDGLIGITIARSDGDMNFNITDNLETTVTSVHPYLIRPFNGAQLWTTIGYGAGDAELQEPDTVIKTDIKVLTGAFGVTHVQGDLLTANIGALFSRAKLDSATGNDKTLPAVTVSALRITAGAEVGWTHGDWRPFLTVNLRHDAGDGDDGGAIDGGGGVEYQTATVNVRLEAAGQVQGNGADENRLSLTAGKTAGRPNLGLTVTAANGIDTANLLSGEWRF